MNILLLGAGGREHALAWKTEQSPLCSKLYIAPGNAGTQQCGTNVDLQISNFRDVAQWVADHHIDMVIVGPEDPLVNGITDYLARFPGTEKVMVIGPGKQGARLEGSKKFAKEFMLRHHIPTAAFQSFDAQTYSQGVDFLGTLKPPYVLKADGLAAGKGVLILDDLQKAVQELDQMLNSAAFGAASEKVVIEEFMDGIEVSVFVATDGRNYIVLPEAKDYKRIGEGDAGPNTGGMGAVSPVPFAGSAFMKKVRERIIEPTIEGLRKEDISYKGFIFLGLMNVKGDPFVVEYNVRLGDPETQAIIPRIQSDMVYMMQCIASGKLDEYTLEICPEFSVATVLVSGGYPGSYEKGKEISRADQVENSHVFYAGVAENDQKLTTSGGRVLAVTSVHHSMQQAMKQSQENAEKIQFDGRYFRKDIGKDLQK